VVKKLKREKYLPCEKMFTPGHLTKSCATHVHILNSELGDWVDPQPTEERSPLIDAVLQDPSALGDASTTARGLSVWDCPYEDVESVYSDALSYVPAQPVPVAPEALPVWDLPVLGGGAFNLREDRETERLEHAGSAVFMGGSLVADAPPPSVVTIEVATPLFTTDKKYSSPPVASEEVEEETPVLTEHIVEKQANETTPAILPTAPELFAETHEAGSATPEPLAGIIEVKFPMPEPTAPEPPVEAIELKLPAPESIELKPPAPGLSDENSSLSSRCILRKPRPPIPPRGRDYEAGLIAVRDKVQNVVNQLLGKVSIGPSVQKVAPEKGWAIETRILYLNSKLLDPKTSEKLWMGFLDFLPFVHREEAHTRFRQRKKELDQILLAQRDKKVSHVLSLFWGAFNLTLNRQHGPLTAIDLLEDYNCSRDGDILKDWFEEARVNPDLTVYQYVTNDGKINPAGYAHVLSRMMAQDSGTTVPVRSYLTRYPTESYNTVCSVHNYFVLAARIGVTNTIGNKNSGFQFKALRGTTAYPSAPTEITRCGAT
jgi:hypothetical protein